MNSSIPSSSVQGAGRSPRPPPLAASCRHLASAASRGLGPDASAWQQDLEQTVALLLLEHGDALSHSQIIYRARQHLLNWMGLSRQQTNHVRRLVRHCSPVDPHVLSSQTTHGNAPSPAWQLSLQETFSAVHRVLALLPPDQAALLRTHCMDGRPVTDEIAQEYGLRSRHQLRSRLQASMEAFRRHASSIDLSPAVLPSLSKRCSQIG